LQDLVATHLSYNRSINQSEYAPLTLRPIAVSIETKTPDGSVQEGKAQLSIWAAAHFERLRSLAKAKRQGEQECVLDDNDVEEKEEVISMPLPLVLISGSSWILYFAVDEADRIVSCD
jgi:hypothetical protein